MDASLPLQPTLWRTCRVLANRTRLHLFRLLARHPGQTVSTVASRLKLPLPVASQYLRAMEARGLLTARRAGLRVSYRISAGGASPARGLVTALRLAFRREPAPIEPLFKLATAFTHPRRIEIFRLLNGQPRTRGELMAATGISARAMMRHVGKLKDRGFVVCRRGQYAVVNRFDGLGRELARWAADERGGTRRTLQSTPSAR